MKKHKPYGPYEKYFKRALDLFCGLMAVIVFWLVIHNSSYISKNQTRIACNIYTG